MSSLLIFTDRSIIPIGARHCDLMIPFWGHYETDTGFGHLRNWRAFQEFEAWATRNWQLTSIDRAEIAVLPFDGCALLDRTDGLLESRAIAQRFVEEAKSAGLRTIVIVRSDSIEYLPLDDAVIVLRHSLNRRTRRANEFSLYETFEEFVPQQRGGAIEWRPYREAPVVGFCGFAARQPPALKTRLKRWAVGRLDAHFGYYVPEKDGTYLRYRAMKRLSESGGVETRFVVRDEPFFGKVYDAEVRATLRATYTANLLESDYALCVRGWGNHSVRFYEAMALGRTPVLVDTYCVLPYDFLHDYSRLCVIVPSSQVDKIAEYVRDHHSRFTPRTYREHQAALHEFWSQWLSPTGFCEHISDHWKRATPDRHDVSARPAPSGRG